MKFILNRPIVTETPRVVVDGTLKAGVNRFQLEVLDAAGNRSRPAIVDILVTRSSIPPIDNPVITNPIRDRPIPPIPPIR